jgi:hypothetical protein
VQVPIKGLGVGGPADSHYHTPLSTMNKMNDFDQEQQKLIDEVE